MAKKGVSKSEPKADDVEARSGELALLLPGADSVDKVLVDNAVVKLNQLYRTKGLETAKALAECVIAIFFGGDAEAFASRGRRHVSFQELQGREDLQVSYLFLWNSCAVYNQLRLLPDDIGNALPMSHHKLLLPVKNTETKVALAETAVGENLSKRDFALRVKEARDTEKSESKLGRPPLPAFAKAFAKLDRIATLAGSEPVSQASFEHYSKEDARALLSNLEKQLDALKSVAHAVQLVLDAEPE